MIVKRYLLLLILLPLNYAFAQPTNGSVNDSLSAKKRDYQYHEGVVKESHTKAATDAKAQLLKAKKEQDYHQMVSAYKAMLYLSDKKQHLVYADSMLAAAKRTKDNLLLGAAYLTRATVYYGRKDHTKALDNFIKADEYISKTKDSNSIYKVKYGIAQTKYYLGFYDEAISLFRECIDYFKEENDRAYLNSLHSLGLCYNRIGNYEWCTLTNQMGIDEGRLFENLDMECYFNHSEGINQCSKGNYAIAIRKLDSIVPELIKLKDFANEAVAYFYIGKSYWAIKEKEEAISYFKKVDSLFEKQHYIRPDMREGYECLITYYEQRDDTKSQLLYINRLLKVDHILAQNYKYLLQKIVKEYDTKELIKAKKHIESRMFYRTVSGFLIIFILAVVIGYLIYRHFKNKKLFEELMLQSTVVATLPKNNSKPTTYDITPEIETAILKKLDKFEHTKKYLEKDMNLVRMAALLNTNTKYVTKIIAKHRNKGTIDYISDLKLDYIIELLKTENKFRNYTNKALGDEAGFGSTQNFTRAFKNRTGITPTYFISKLIQSATGSSE